MKVEITSVSLDRVRRLSQEWQLRVRAVERRFLKRAVNQVYDDLLGYLPTDRDALRDSLQVSRIRGLPDDTAGYAIRSVPKMVRAARESQEDMVIYVAAKPNLMQALPESVKILADYSPWTLETLPYPPDPKTADIISRRVSRREVIKVTKARRRDLPSVRRMLSLAGIRVADMRTSMRGRGIAALPDIAFESLRLEFGLGGAPSKPHWRRAILKLALRGGVGRIAKKKELFRALSDLSFRRWRQWLVEKGRGISPVQARKYVPFEKRLGLNVRRR